MRRRCSSIAGVASATPPIATVADISLTSSESDRVREA